MDRDTEIRLIRQSATDPGAFGELFEENYDRILRYCVYHTAQVEIARDITAETFFKAFKNIGKFHHSSAPFSAWLYRIAANEIVDFFRKKKYRHKLLTETMHGEGLLSFDSRINLQNEADILQRKLDENQTYQNVRRMIGPA